MPILTVNNDWDLPHVQSTICLDFSTARIFSIVLFCNVLDHQTLTWINHIATTWNMNIEMVLKLCSMFVDIQKMSDVLFSIECVSWTKKLKDINTFMPAYFHVLVLQLTLLFNIFVLISLICFTDFLTCPALLTYFIDLFMQHSSANLVHWPTYAT